MTGPRRSSGRATIAAARAAAADGALAIVRDPLRLLLFALTVITISRVHQHYPMLAKLRPALLLVVAATVYAALRPRLLTAASIFRSWPMRRVLILAVLACGSAVFGISLGRSASFILNSYVKTIVFAMLIALAVRSVRDLYTFVWAYSISCGILAFFSMFVFGLTKASNSYVTRLGDMYTYDSNDLGVVLMVGIALTLLLLVVARGPRRFFLLANLACIAATIARSGSRGGFVGFVALCGAALVIVNSVSFARRITLLIAAVAALALGAPPGYWQQMGTVLEPTSDYNFSSLDGRKALLQRGLGYMADYPAFGLGIDNFMRAECTISPKIETLGRTRRRCTPPHNSFIEAGAELGVPGLLVWCSILFSGVVAFLRLRGQLPRNWRYGNETERFLHGATTYFPLAIIGFAVTSFFVSFAWMDVLYFLTALMAGYYTALATYRSSSQTDGGATDRAFATPIGGWRVRRSRHRSGAAAREEQLA